MASMEDFAVLVAEDLNALEARTSDTGWRDVSDDLLYGATGTMHIRREGLTIWWRVADLTPGTGHAFYFPPAGMVSPSSMATYPAESPAADAPVYIDNVGRICRNRSASALTSGRWWSGSYVLPTGTPPMTTLPGTPT